MTALLNGDKQDYRVVGDNPNDITDTKYGNNNVMGPDKEKFFMERTLQELLHRLETTILRTDCKQC
jgi:hypothetical protein